MLFVIVDLENGDIANSREAQLQSSSQDPSHERDAPRRRSRRRTSESVLYSDFVKQELQRLLIRSKDGADVAFESGDDNDRMRHRNWLSSINPDSGEFSRRRAESSHQRFVGKTLLKTQRYIPY